MGAADVLVEFKRLDVKAERRRNLRDVLAIELLQNRSFASIVESAARCDAWRAAARNGTPKRGAGAPGKCLGMA